MGTSDHVCGSGGDSRIAPTGGWSGDNSLVSLFLDGLMARRRRWIPASAGMTVWGGTKVISEESLMSVVTGTADHVCGSGGDSRIAPTGGWPEDNSLVSLFLDGLMARRRRWIPASAGMTVWGGTKVISEESLMSVITGTADHVCGSGGDSRIAPTGGWSGGIFVAMASRSCEQGF